jgi:hypothetical protein
MRVEWALLGMGSGMMFPSLKPFETIGIIGAGALLVGVGLYFVITALGW